MADRTALIIANNEFDDPTLTRLATPSRDAEALAEVLRDPAVGAFKVRVLLNDPLWVVRRQIGRLFERKRREDLLLLYYSGHGFRDDYGELYLAVRDTDRKAFSATGLDAAFVRSQLDRSNSQRKLVLLDCCHSGAFTGKTKSGLGDSVGTDEAFGGSGYGRVILTASNAIQYAWQGDEIRGEVEPSVFTGFVVQGLQTGEADLDGDGDISADELYKFVYEKVITSGHTKQTPRFWASDIEGQIVIARSTYHMRQQKLERLYQAAQEEMKAGRWQDAHQLLTQVQEMEPGFRNVERLLDEVELEIEKEKREKQIREKKLKADDLYAEAVRLLDAGKYTEALEKWQEVKKLVPAYPDSQNVEATAREKLAEQTAGTQEPATAQPSTTSDKPIPWRWIAGAAGLVAIVLIVFVLVLNGGGGEGGKPILLPTSDISLLEGIGRTKTREQDDAVMVYVPGGTFEMGSAEGDNNEEPVHSVTLDAFWIDKHEVTNAQFAAFLDEEGNQTEGGTTWLNLQAEGCLIEQVGGEYRPKSGYGSHPVIFGSWYGARAYCEWAGARLPTEAEWEYAARGPDENIYPWGGDEPTCELANLSECARGTMPVGSLPDGASWCEALDMAGNVWEWVSDWYGEYPSTAQNNPIGPETGDNKVLRGGAWHTGRDRVRSTSRNWDFPRSGYYLRGFRCVGAATPSG